MGKTTKQSPAQSEKFLGRDSDLYNALQGHEIDKYILITPPITNDFHSGLTDILKQEYLDESWVPCPDCPLKDPYHSNCAVHCPQDNVEIVVLDPETGEEP